MISRDPATGRRLNGYHKAVFLSFAAIALTVLAGLATIAPSMTGDASRASQKPASVVEPEVAGHLASGKSLVSGKSLASGESQAKTLSATDSSPPVVDRSSSAAALAKGEINFDDLKFDIEKDAPFQEEKLNDSVRALDGRKVKLRGYILPATVYKETGIERFVLVRDNQECCFGPGAALFDCVCIEMEPGKTADFSTLPVTVEGKFEIDTDTYRYPEGDGSKGATHFSIFRIRGLTVQ